MICTKQIHVEYSVRHLRLISSDAFFHVRIRTECSEHVNSFIDVTCLLSIIVILLALLVFIPEGS